MTSAPALPTAAATRAAEAFELPGPADSVERYGSGHINDTFLVTCRTPGGEARVVLQRVNGTVFPEPEKVQQNVARVTAHLARRLEEEGFGDRDRRVLTFLPARDGPGWHVDAEGSLWRAYRFVGGARSHDVAAGPFEARAAARAFATFARLLDDLPAPRLHETIPAFHDTRRRLERLEEAVRRDPRGRASGARGTVDAYLARERYARVLGDALAAGRLHERVAHNDTKLNNVLLDDVTGEGICVIDLDTVMPGLLLHDFGDLVRTAATTAAEDEEDLARVGVDAALFGALVEGTVQGLDGGLSPFERESLPLAGRVITFETGIRFLTDHLLGDVYFRIHRPGHNLARARSQLALLLSLEERDAELAAAAERVLGGRAIPAASRRAGRDTTGEGAPSAPSPARPA